MGCARMARLYGQSALAMNGTSAQCRPAISGASDPVAAGLSEPLGAPPRILLVSTTRDWPVAARLAIRFSEAGCRVEAICPSRNPVLKTTALSRALPYNALAPLRSLRRLIREPGYDLVVPCDDLATAHFSDIYEAELRVGRSAQNPAVILERSFGAPRSLTAITTRSSLLEIAREEGIGVPDWKEIQSLQELKEWLASNGLPAVLKADGTAGGRGVRIVSSYGDSKRAFQILSRLRIPRAAKRLIVNRDFTVVLPCLLSKQFKVNAQSFVPGRDATVSLSCWEGRILASTAFEVLETTKPNGPASVVRLTDNVQMHEAAIRLVRRLRLSGLYGLDFRIDENRRAWLIEMNPRATQSSHLSVGNNGDLVGSLVSAVSGRSACAKTQVTSSPIVAFFPNQWKKDPASGCLTAGYHDVPWSEPELVRLLLKKASLAERYF